MWALGAIKWCHPRSSQQPGLSGIWMAMSLQYGEEGSTVTLPSMLLRPGPGLAPTEKVYPELLCLGYVAGRAQGAEKPWGRSRG